MEKIEAIVDRLEGNKAVLVLNDGQKIIVSRTHLKPEIKEGAVLRINFLPSRQTGKNKAKRVQRLLSKILSHKAHEDT